MLRTWGRDTDGNWVQVTTDSVGYNDQVYLTTLCQVLRLNLGESPFYANYGIPAQQTIATQVFPDLYAAKTQEQFSPYFAALTIQRVPNTTPPVYNVNVVTHSGATLSASVIT